MRRRTKPRVVWLPPSLENTIDIATDRNGINTFIVEAAGPIGAFSVGEIPITIDGRINPISTTQTLSDVENSGYRLRRIVGKIFAFAQQNAEATPQAMAVTAGIIVRRIDPDIDQSLASLDVTGFQQSVQDAGNWTDPWIWRRTWILFNNESLSTPERLGPGPISNIEYGSVADGPHVDAKTARIVGPEERLFLDVTVSLLENGNGVLLGPVQIFTDLRVLASMRTSVGNRRNASR